MTYPIRSVPDNDTVWGPDLRATIAGVNDHQNRVTSLESRTAALEAGGSGGGGGVNAADVGYDLLLLLGQSNMAGWAVDGDSTRFDVTDPRVAQFGASGAFAGVISQAVEPLAMHDSTTPGVGPALHFARWYLHTVPANRRVLLVPAAHGGTPLSSGVVLAWRRGVTGNLYAQALTQTQAALTAAGANARVTAALWVQGEADGDANVSGATYQTDLDTLITGLRTDLALPTLPFVIGQMVPDYLSFGTRTAINAVHVATPTRISRTGFGAGITGANRGDSNHYNAAGARALARNMFSGYLSALALVLTNSVAPVITGTTTTGQTLTSSTGTWSATPDSYTYQWKRAGVAISGETASTHVLVVADEGQLITCTVTAIKTGYPNGSATTASVTPSSGSGGTLTNSVLPVISGTAVTGQTLTSSTGTWSAAPDSYTYQWKRAGSAISGETAATHVLVVSDEGQAITCTVTAIKATYTSGVATTASVTPTSGAAVVTDAFTRADSGTIGTTETGGLTWATSGTGTWDIVSNKLRCTSPNTTTGSQCVVDVSGAGGSASGTISATLSSFTTSLNGLLIRGGTDNTSAAYVAFRNAAAKFELMRRNAGGGFTAITVSSTDVAAGNTLTVIISGSTITGKVNGTQVWSVTDTTITSGTRMGFFAYGTTGETAQFDSFSYSTATS